MTSPDPAAMSTREGEVLEAVSEHLTNAEIARRLHISVRTVESHVSSLLRKLGATDRRELAALAARRSTASAATPRDMLGLPSPWTTFVGREAELAEVTKALAEHRMVTLLGPGGIGKTRLAVVAAQQAGPRFPGGGAFVDLVPVSPEFVVHAAAAALGVVERPLEPLDRVVHERLRAGPVLLVLDNCEHLLEAAATFAQGALTVCPDLVVLATSRERLGLTGERLIPVPPLPVAPVALADDAIGSEAERLFLDRAAIAGAAQPDLRLVTEICGRLDGVPLAIELAAARSAALGVDGLVTGLNDHLRLLSTGGPASRHRSLRAVMHWSHDLLDTEERTMFRRLGIFAGAFDLAAVAAVVTDGDAVLASDAVARLTDKSLLVHRPDGTRSRWHMLQTIQAYAREQLQASGDHAQTRERHLWWAATTALALEASLTDEGGWQASFDLVADDLRAALAGVSATGPAPGDRQGFDLARALGHLTYARRFLVEAHDHYATAVRLAPDDRCAARALREAADAAHAELRGDAAFTLLMASSERAGAAGDVTIAALTLADAAMIAGRHPATFVQRLTPDELSVLNARVGEMAPPGDVEVAAHVSLARAFQAHLGTGIADPELSDRALRQARDIDDPVLISVALDAVASVLTGAGRHKAAARLAAERVQLVGRMQQHELRSGGEVADVYHTASETAVAAGDLEMALASARLAYEDTANRQGLAHFGAAHLVVPLALQGAFDEALLQAAVMRAGWERTGRPAVGWMSPSFFASALVHGLRGEEAEYRDWWELAEHVGQHSVISEWFRRYAGARLALHLGNLDAASAYTAPAPSVIQSRFGAYYRAISVEVAVAAGQADAEARLAGAQGLGAENDFVAASLARAAGRLHQDVDELTRAVRLWTAVGARFERACTLLAIPGDAAEGRRQLALLGCVEPAA